MKPSVRSLQVAFVIASCVAVACGTKAEAPAKTEAAAKTDDAAKPDAATNAAAAAKAEADAAALRDAYYKVCNAEQLSGAADTDPAMKSMHIARWLEREVKAQPVIDLLTSIAVLDAAQRGPRMRAAAKAAGVEPCPIADAT